MCVILLAGSATKAQQTDTLKEVEGKYWAYLNSAWDANKNSVHTFTQEPNESFVEAKGTGMIFDANGTFREIADPKKITGSQPCKGTWTIEKSNTLKVNCGGKIWHYKVLKADNGVLLVTIKK